MNVDNLTMDNFTIREFPNGEWGVKIDPTLHPDNHTGLNLDFSWPDPLNPDLMLPLLMGAAMRQVYGRVITLKIPYLPYLRQDRSFEHGVPIASGLATKMLAGMFSTIKTLEPHSIPCPGIRYNHFVPDLNFRDYRNVMPAANAPAFPDSLRFMKERTAYGDIVMTPLDKYKTKIHTAIIRDDLCDGGATFIECAKQLRDLGFKEVVLCVAHGFFTRGVDHLFNNGIDKIITTDSVCRLKPSEKLTILNAFEEISI